MGLMDILKGKKERCGFCKKEGVELPHKKKFDEGEVLFCSKECSRDYRIRRKKKDKGSGVGGGLPW